ncbi:SusC/RagA family TonB-linked outer membrane protein [Puteibacter caeruleilacunae]|nr:SusC/RagA family TonB-linked outer membrane protein [Puteibacter caeruleilacunae]
MKKHKLYNSWVQIIPNMNKIWRIMRLTGLLMLVFTTIVSANTYSQNTRFSIDLENTTLNELFIFIEKNSDYRFAYNKAVLDDSEIISIKAKNETIHEILDKVLKTKNLSIKINDRFVFITKENRNSSTPKKDQTIKKITGNVTDSSGDPMPGVTVRIKGTTNGTVTDPEGNYSILEVPSDGILLFSFVGMKNLEIEVSGNSVINARLTEAAIGVEEVVVVAYGMQKKSHLTAAVSQIKGETLENRPLRTAADGLIGTVPGLNVRTPSGAPEATPSLNIRGFTGLGLKSNGDFETKSAEPLVLVDGVERSIADVNPNDIETISVLKDGASTAIYGSRAPYGAVIITTKTGKKNTAMKVNYSGNISFASPTNTPEQLQSYEWATYINEAFRNRDGGGKAGMLDELQMARILAWQQGDFDNPAFEGIDPSYIPYGVYAKNSKQWDIKYGGYGFVNHVDEVIKDVVPSHNHNLSVSGGGAKATYYASVGYKQNNGILKDVDNYKNRYNALIRTNIDVSKWLNLNFSADYVKTKETGPSYRGGGRNYSKIWADLSYAWPIWAEVAPGGGIMDFSILPNLDGTGGYEKIDNNKLTLTGGVKLEPVKNWIINGRYTYRNTSSHKYRTDLSFEQTLPDGTTDRHNRSINMSSMNRVMKMTDYYTFDINTSYTKDIRKHHFYILAGVQQEYQKYTTLTGSGNDFFSITNTTLAGISGEEFADDEIQDYATRGFYGRINYNYAGKYLLEINTRYDATSRFLAKDRWAIFPSVSVAWNAAKENFWPLKDIISDFKVRGSWATSGDGNPANLGNYPFYPSIETSSYTGAAGKTNLITGGELASYTKMPELVSSDLTWSKPTSIDFAIDLTAFSQRLSFTYDWYQRTMHDQVGFPMVLPEVLGSDVPKSNNSTTETRGWELSLNWRDTAFKIAGKDVKYQVGFSLSDYIGYVVEFENSGTGQISGQWYPGEVFGQNYHYAFNGLAQNTADLYNNVFQGSSWYYPGDVMLKDLNGDGQISSGDGGVWYAMGDVIKNGFNYPRKTYSINLSADWNNISLSVLLDGVGQWNKYSANPYVFGTDGNKFHSPFFQENVDLGYWSVTNPEAFYPRLDLTNKNLSRANDYYDLNLAHLRIRNVKLGYTLPKIKGLSRTHIYISAENLGYIYQKSFVKFDPELLAASNGQGYPSQRIISCGINLEF